ncbi:transcriptional regulator with XRE-family HTH domain/tetratricopeptide (TPR) repeat protein [Clavibacter sp. B3I6]|uniref:helix-turn-helix domain-containing protein n=1 Tax=Clavibacter sp. B3I6 TaxID=3042268 RepID=UPI00278A5228|nr:helix-turn-helix domain-containing protein [Clavibacter sp. B3I6]MDQ0744197.1 transcriptional regulator with XRE-family HTH domain/tetratricopeptide (TPR) repeat protein [Clavibacter sp. B3I6]
MTGVGGLLRGLRMSADLTLEALAERSGVSVRTISDIERGVSARPRRATAHALADALGLEGSRRDRLLAAARPTAEAAAGSTTRPAGSGGPAPYRLADFRGRDEEIERLVAAATGPAAGPRHAPTLVVLSGAPGVGKSSIAVEAAHRITAGSRPPLFVDLGGLDDAPAEPLHVIQSLLRQLTGAEGARGDLADATAAWAAATAAQPVVVVLDDAATEAQVRPVMAADPGATVLVTSRRTLAGLASARHLRVPVLPRRDGVALLEAIVPEAQRVGADLDELARLCGDLPLALRVAGHRIASQPASTVEDHVRRLRAEGRRLGALVAGDTGVQAAFATSCAHLTPGARDLFRSLALLRGSSFAAPMAGAVLGLGEDAALGLLDELADLGMVETMSGSRYRLHDLLRLYAAERLHADVDPVEIRRRSERLGRWTLATAAAAGRVFAPDDAPHPRLGPALAFGSRAAARAWLVTEVDAWFPEYAAAATDGREALALAAAPHIRWFGDRWFEWGRWHELFAVTAELAHRAGDAVLEAEALTDVAFIQHYARWDPAAAVVTARRALALATASGDGRGRARALSDIGACLEALGDVDGAVASTRLAITAFEQLGLPGPVLDSRGVLARSLLATDPAAGLAAYEEILERTREPQPGMAEHDRWAAHLDALAQCGKALVRLGRHTESIELAETMLTTADGPAVDHAGERDRARALRNRGLARLALGEVDAGRADLERALVLAGDLPPAEWSAEIRDALDGLPAATA